MLSLVQAFTKPYNNTTCKIEKGQEAKHTEKKSRWSKTEQT